MRKYLLSVVAVLALGSTRAPAAELLDGVVAIVNDRVITWSEVRGLVDPIVPQLHREFTGEELTRRVRQLQKEALDSLIDRALIVHEFKSKGYSFPDNMIEQQITEEIERSFAGDRAAFIKTLQAQNVTLSQYREQVRDRTIVQAMRSRKAQQAAVVSPYKIEKIYREKVEDFKVEDQVKLRMIFIKKSPNAAGEDDPRRLLGQEIIAKLKAGTSFADLAKQYSDGREGKAGGDWGWIGRNVIRKELDEVAFQLKGGEHSNLIETAEGFYILQVDEFKAAHNRSLSEARDEIEKMLLQEQRTKVQEEWLKELRAKSFIRYF